MFLAATRVRFESPDPGADADAGPPAARRQSEEPSTRKLMLLRLRELPPTPSEYTPGTTVHPPRSASKRRSCSVPTVKGTVWGFQAYRSKIGPFSMFSGVYDLVGGEHATRQFGRIVFE